MTTATLTVFCRVSNKGDRGAESEFVARRLGDQVRYLFESPAMRADLSRKGLTRCRVVRGPVAQPFPGYQVRIVTIQTILRYSMALPVNVTSAVPGLVQYVVEGEDEVAGVTNLFNYTVQSGFTPVSPANADLGAITPGGISIDGAELLTFANGAVNVGRLSANSTEAFELPRLDFYMDGTRVASLGSDGEFATRAFIEADSNPFVTPAFVFTDAAGNWLASLNADGLYAPRVATA